MSHRFCIHCGTRLPASARFCSHCGYAVETSVAENEAIPKAKKERHIFTILPNLITKGLVLLLATFMVVMSFLPMISLPLESDNDARFEGADFKLNVFEVVGLFTDSFFFLSESELEDDSVFEHYVEASESIKGIEQADYEDLKPNERRAIHSFALYTLRLSVRSDAIALGPSFYIGAVCAVLYVAFTIIFFFLAFFAFLGALGIAKFSSKRLEFALYVMLSSVPMVALLTYAALSFGLGQAAVTIPTVSEYALFNSFRFAFSQGTDITVSLLLPTLISAPVILWVALTRIIFYKVRYSASTLIKRAFAIALSLGIFFLAFAPIVNCTFTGKFASVPEKTKHMTVSMGANAFSTFIYTERQMDLLDELHQAEKEEADLRLSENLSTIYSLPHRDGDNAVAIKTNADMISELWAIGGLHKMATLFSFLPVVLFGMMACALTLLQANVAFFMHGANSERRAYISKIMMLIFAALALLMVIVFLISISILYKQHLHGEYKTLISAAFVFLMIFNVGAACVPVLSASPAVALSKTEKDA